LFQIKSIKEDNSVELQGSSLKRLYGVYAESYSDGMESIPLEVVKGFYEKYFGEEKPNWIWIGIKRTPVEGFPGKNGSPYRTEVIYLFSSKEDRDSFSSFFPSLRPMNGLELANRLFRFHSLVSPYYFTDKGLGLKGVPIITPDTIYSALLRGKYKDFFFNELEKARCRKDFPYRIYKSVLPTSERPSLKKLFSVPWYGVLWIKAGFGNFYNTLKLRAQTLSVERASKWKKIAQAHRNGELPLALVEMAFIVPQWLELPQILGSALSVVFAEWYVKWINYLYDPITSYDETHTHFFTLDKVAKIMPLSYGKSSFRKGEEPVFIYGFSPSPIQKNKGELFYFHLAEEGKFHSIIVAPQRSGKSVTNQIIISTLIKVDPKKLYYGKIKPFRLPVKVAQFDVGFSAEFFVELLKRRGFNVRVFPPKRDIKINPLEIDKADEIPLAVKLIALLFENRGGSRLNPEEIGLLEKAIKILLSNKKLWLSYDDTKELITIKETHPHLYDLAVKKGLKGISLLREAIKLGPEFKVFDYPTLVDLVKVLKKMREETRIKEEKRILEELAFKMNTVSQIENFSTWSSSSFEPVDYLYIDLHYVKELDLFVPIYLALLTRTLKMLSKFPFNTPKYLSVDEFHNFVKYKTFTDFFEVLVREAAKRNIYLTFISQNVDDFPEKVVLNVRTRIILKGQESSGGKTSDFLDSVREKFRLSDSTMERYKELPRYSALITYGEGAFFGTSWPTTKEGLMVFESRKIPVLKTPDGIVIKKTFVEE